MAAERFIFEIFTPYRLFFSEEVEAVSLTLEDGEVGIYANHSLFTAPVQTCAMRIKRKDGIWKPAFISDGVIEVKRHKTVLLAGSANWPEEIDYQRMVLAKEKAEAVMKDSAFKFESAQAAANLRRAEVRLKVYEMRDKTAETASAAAEKA
jgi:F-type H+-transporting ATPase subunit epsilon